MIAALGDRALLITLGTEIDEATHAKVRAVCTDLTAARLKGVVDIVPAYASVAVHYDPSRTGYDSLYAQVAAIVGRAATATPLPARVVEIPVRYGGDEGPDLETLAQARGLSPDEVVRLHTGVDYLVHLIGFAPGFPYLGGLDPRLATPRRDTPRVNVPAGSVGIGGSQTGIYPFDSPGGWHLIGRTPLTLFDPARDEPSLLHVGDRVRFRPVS